MNKIALFIDLPNLYGQLIRSDLVTDPKMLRDYFLNWLDFDLLAKKLTNFFPNIWVFYSSSRVGPSEARIDGKFLKSYIHRINSLQGITARDVNIPGQQRETLIIRCEKCGQETETEWRSEKGIDASMTVHLFDTMDSWDTAYLLSGDADFVPVVESLRRRGKIVIGGGFSSASSALVRECYEYMELADIFIKEDFIAYLLFRSNGIVHQWFIDAHPDPRYDSRDITLGLKWARREYKVQASISADGSYDISHWNTQISKLRSKLKRIDYSFDGQSSERFYQYSFNFDEVHWVAIQRRLNSLITSIEGLEQVDKNKYEAKYICASDATKYSFVK